MTSTIDESAQYLIKTVSKRSGVKSDLVRAWERRYQAVTPTRTSGGHRIYTDQDIARLVVTGYILLRIIWKNVTPLF